MFETNYSENSIPDNQMTLAIVATILGLCSPCCIGFVLGIIAIVFSSQVKSKFEKGDFAGALSSAKNSKTLAYIAIGLLILNIVYLYFLGGVATYQDILEIYNI